MAVKVAREELCGERLKSVAYEAATLWSLQKHPYLLVFYGIAHLKFISNDNKSDFSLVFEYCPTTLERELAANWEIVPGGVVPRQAKVRSVNSKLFNCCMSFWNAVDEITLFFSMICKNS